MKILSLVFFLLFFLLPPQIGLAQLYAARFDLWVERVPMRDSTAKATCEKQSVLMVSGRDRFGIISPTDTLALIYEPKRIEILRNEINGDCYVMSYVMSYRNKDGFIIFLTPLLEEAPHATHSIILATSNICNK